jgi:hypothetical protein
MWRRQPQGRRRGSGGYRSPRIRDLPGIQQAVIILLAISLGLAGAAVTTMAVKSAYEFSIWYAAISAILGGVAFAIMLTRPAGRDRHYH